MNPFRTGDVVTIQELAVVLEMDRSAALKYVKRLGITPLKRRTATSGYQLASVLTLAQANHVFALRRAEGYC